MTNATDQEEMIHYVSNEAMQFRQEHARIVEDLAFKKATARNRIHNPGKLRATAARIASRVVPASHVLETCLIISTGPLLHNEINSLQEAYDQNIQASAAHKDEYYQDYLALAHEGMDAQR